VYSGVSEVEVASEAFHKTLDEGDLVMLAEHESFEILSGAIFYRSSWAFGVGVGPGDWKDGIKSRFSKNGLGEPASFTYPQDIVL